MANDRDGFLTKEGGRLDGMQSFYYEMCEDMYVGYVDLEKAYEAMGARPAIANIEDPDGYEAYLRERQAHDQLVGTAIKIIVIASMCLEAAIYDYAAWHFPASTVDDQLDKLDLYAKWSLVPRLAMREGLAAGVAGMGSLKQLIRLRNMLVHSKSRPMPMEGKELHAALESLGEKTRKIIAGGHEAMRAIILLSLEWDKRLGSRTINPLPHFINSPMRSPKTFPAALQPLLDRCRRISAAAPS